MRLFRTKPKYTLCTEFNDNGTWTAVGGDEYFDHNPNITPTHAAFAKLAWIDEWNQYGSPEIKGRTYRLALYRHRFGRMRLIQVEPIPAVEPVDLTNFKWPESSKKQS